MKTSALNCCQKYVIYNVDKILLHFRLFLTTEQTDFFIVHWFGFIFDLTVGFWILFDKTRIPAMIVCTTFHLMNSRLFSIGNH